MASNLKAIIPDREPDLEIIVPRLPPSKNLVDRMKLHGGYTGYKTWFDMMAVENMIHKYHLRRVAGRCLVEVQFCFPHAKNLCDVLNLLGYAPLMDALTLPRGGGKHHKPGIGVIDDDNPRKCHVWAAESVVDGTSRTIIRVWKRE